MNLLLDNPARGDTRAVFFIFNIIVVHLDKKIYIFANRRNLNLLKNQTPKIKLNQ